MNLTEGRIGHELVQDAIHVGPGQFVLAGGRAKQRTGFDSLIIFDVALVALDWN